MNDTHMIRLSGVTYERLRWYAFQRRLSFGKAVDDLLDVQAAAAPIPARRRNASRMSSPPRCWTRKRATDHERIPDFHPLLLRLRDDPPPQAGKRQ